MDDLERRWATLAGRSATAAEAGRELVRRWSEPHRHYHDTTHLVAVLDAIDLLADDADDADAVRFAAWFHDAVYAGRPDEDERASAELARVMLTGLGLAPTTVDETERLVLLTRRHDPELGDANGAVLCDADLAVLGGSPEQYAAYAAAVRDDFAHVSDDAFHTGRSEVLERLLAAEPLYRTAAARERWDRAARHNMQTELTLLRAHHR